MPLTARHKMTRILFFLAAVITPAILLVTPSNAALVRDELSTITQPDGSSHQVKIWGDEFYRVLESLDGYTVIREPDSGIYCYAQLSDDGNDLVTTGVPISTTDPTQLDLPKHIRIPKTRAREKALKARKALNGTAMPAGKTGDWPYPPCDGVVNNICLLVDFPDCPATIPVPFIDALLNNEGFTGFGNNGSVRDFFMDASDQNMELLHTVQTVYYRAPFTKSYFAASSSQFGDRARLLIELALNNLENQGFDFSPFDCNGDTLIDGITLLYAGGRQDGDLWPHSSSIDLEYGGLSTFRYVVTNIDNPPSISLLCHELGHAIGGFPDLYDYGGDSQGAGNYCLMSSDSTRPFNPARFSTFCLKLAGWCDLVELTPDMQGTTLPVDVNSRTTYIYNHPTDHYEYYLISNRQQTGRDELLSDHGLAIWHIDHLGTNDFQQATQEFHYITTLLQADGRHDLENNLNSGDSTDLWAAPDGTVVSPFTIPNTNWWSGDSSGLTISNISESGPVMSFVFGPAQTAVEDVPTTSSIGVTPNPFNPTAHISWSQHKSTHTRLAIYDLQGRLVQVLVDEIKMPGEHKVRWNGQDSRGHSVASGIYMANLQAGTVQKTQKLVLAR